MASDLKQWERPHYESGASDALIFYVVYGSFANEAAISRTKYRTEGLPDEVQSRKLTREDAPVLPFTEGDFAKVLRGTDSNLFTQIEQAPGCIVLQGEIPDPPDLNYLRDCVGTIMYFLEHGAIAVLDVQQLTLFDAAQWRRDFFDVETPNVNSHVKILFSEDTSGEGCWYQTRGMRKFARPDLSLRNVPEKFENATIDLCNRFIGFQALGGRIPEGKEIRMASLPDGLICRHKGSLDDPDFNNVHIEIQFPATP
jgi:hypothetical protein